MALKIKERVRKGIIYLRRNSVALVYPSTVKKGGIVVVSYALLGEDMLNRVISVGGKHADLYF